MKLLILVLLLNSMYSNATANDYICQNQKYESGSHSDLNTQLDSEYCPISHATKKITSWWRPIKVPINEDDKLKELCACALYKLEQSNSKEGQPARTYAEILSTTRVTGKSSVKSATSYWFLLNYKPEYPYASCASGYGQDSCVIIKGFKNQSTTAPVHNLYVGDFIKKADNSAPLVLKGVIKHVKMEVFQ